MSKDSSNISMQKDMWSKIKKAISKHNKILFFILICILILISTRLYILNSELIAHKEQNLKLNEKTKQLTKEKESKIKEIEKMKTEYTELEKQNNKLKSEKEKLKKASVSRGKSISISHNKSHFKSYMDINCITNRSSRQFQFIQENRNKGSLHVDHNGLCKIGDYYMVALGSAFGEIGSKYEATLSTGHKLKVIKSEAKADIHTDPTNTFHSVDGSVLEFLVETGRLNPIIRRDGGPHNLEGFSGSVVKMTKIH